MSSWPCRLIKVETIKVALKVITVQELVEV